MRCARASRSSRAVSAQSAKDGLVIRVDQKGKADVVARNILFARGVCFDAEEKHLYVVQGLAGTVLRYPRRRDGTLEQPKPYGPQVGILPQTLPTPETLAQMSARERGRIGIGDGCAFDAEGNLWVALVYANRIVAITPNHSVSVVINDPEGRLVNMPTNLIFGGPDLRDLYIAMAGTDYILKGRSPVPGLPLAHQR